jgi:hypothetical protein
MLVIIKGLPQFIVGSDEGMKYAYSVNPAHNVHIKSYVLVDQVHQGDGYWGLL